jgi:hypothetical protein
MTEKELGYRVNIGIEKSCTDISKDNKIVVGRKAVKICDDYITSPLLI